MNENYERVKPHPRWNFARVHPQRDTVVDAIAPLPLFTAVTCPESDNDDAGDLPEAHGLWTCLLPAQHPVLQYAAWPFDSNAHQPQSRQYGQLGHTLSYALVARPGPRGFGFCCGLCWCVAALCWPRVVRAGLRRAPRCSSPFALSAAGREQARGNKFSTWPSPRAWSKTTN